MGSRGSSLKNLHRFTQSEMTRYDELYEEYKSNISIMEYKELIPKEIDRVLLRRWIEGGAYRIRKDQQNDTLNTFGDVIESFIKDKRNQWKENDGSLYRGMSVNNDVLNSLQDVGR